MTAPIAVFAAADLDQHTTPSWHPERQGRLDATLSGIPEAGLLDAVGFEGLIGRLLDQRVVAASFGPQVAGHEDKHRYKDDFE